MYSWQLAAVSTLTKRELCEKSRYSDNGDQSSHLGDFDRAFGYIARALADSVAPHYTPALFRLDPIWDALRGRADFRKLIAQR